jgi:hypothetical protein
MQGTFTLKQNYESVYYSFTKYMQDVTKRCIKSFTFPVNNTPLLTYFGINHIFFKDSVSDI